MRRVGFDLSRSYITESALVKLPIAAKLRLSRVRNARSPAAPRSVVRETGDVFYGGFGLKTCRYKGP
jgi:hypothetical protein